MEIVMRKVSELTPYDKNAKKHDAQQIANVAQSIAEMGWKQPLVVDANGVVIVGHCRLLAAKKLKQQEVPCVVADDLTEEQIRKYRILDNKLAESPWDLNLLAEDVEGLNFDEYDLDFVIASEVASEDDERYTKETRIPQYEPHDDSVDVSSLINRSKVDALLEEIDGAGITEEQKEFLRISAYRHCEINFEAVADYYAQQGKEMQHLMERQALVIIDYDDAIANGYAALHTSLAEMLEDDLNA